jgi:hypothetical protein
MSVFDPIKPYLTLLKLAGFLACVVVAFSYGCSKGKEAGESAVRRTEVKQAKAEASAAKESLRLAQEQADRYRTRAESQAAIATQYQEELNHAHDRADATVADLRSGNLRLRKLWEGCKATPVPASGQTASDPGQPEGDSGLQEASVGRIDRAVSACQAHATALLKIAEDDRK